MSAADTLLAWYDKHARRLPWRVGPADRAQGVLPDPYRVWLSEIMLQQTTVAAVKPYFETFLQRWPTVDALAAANTDDIMAAWAGLGYYARARRMKACAEVITRERAGRFPETAAALEQLPGIGPYTAAAIAAIAFDEPVPVVDGNVERVMARIFAISTPLPEAKKDIRARQADLTPASRAGDYAQAVMDLGATICTPTKPACALCPWRDSCEGRKAGIAEGLPVKAPKKARPTRRGEAFVLVRHDGAILLRRRPPEGLLGGMAEVPGSDWAGKAAPTGTERPSGEKWKRVSDEVVHVFTHFRLELTVWRGSASGDARAPTDHWWSTPDELPGEALPSVMKKAIEAALPGATKKRHG